LECIFLGGIPTIRELEIGDIAHQQMFPELEDYQKIETPDAAEEFLVKVFQNSTGNCERKRMCLNVNCPTCVGLYTLFLNLNLKLSKQRNRYYYKCLVTTQIYSNPH
jgi:hypothetical protein